MYFVLRTGTQVAESGSMVHAHWPMGGSVSARGETSLTCAPKLSRLLLVDDPIHDLYPLTTEDVSVAPPPFPRAHHLPKLHTQCFPEQPARRCEPAPRLLPGASGNPLHCPHAAGYDSESIGSLWSTPRQDIRGGAGGGKGSYMDAWANNDANFTARQLRVRPPSQPCVRLRGGSSRFATSRRSPTR